MFNWNDVKDVTFDGEWFIFVDDQGKEARLDKSALIMCVEAYKTSQS